MAQASSMQYPADITFLHHVLNSVATLPISWLAPVIPHLRSDCLQDRLRVSQSCSPPVVANMLLNPQTCIVNVPGADIDILHHGCR